jgi:hypothetical protein
MADAKSELREIKRMGAVPQKNSGRGKHEKGDAVLDGIWMVDVKEYAESFGISLKVWAKTCTDAFRAGGLEPLLKIVLGSGMNRVRVVVISETMFEDMKASYLKDQEGML